MDAVPADLADAVPWEAGENLENDADFGAMERAARGKPEQQVGSLIVPRVEPEWAEVVALAASLLVRTQDLRVFEKLAVARLHTDGVAGFAGVLASIRTVLERHWDGVHPQLDAEDDLDPTLRANALLGLAGPVDVLAVLRTEIVAAGIRAGRVCWRDIAIATGIMDPLPGQEKLSEAVIRAAFQETDRPRLRRLRDGLAAASEHAAAIPAAFDAQAGHGTGPELKDLVKLLREMQKGVERFAPPEEVVVQAAPLPEESPMQPEQSSRLGGEGTAASAASLTAIGTRTEAMHLLDLVAAYYARYEPSSPLPLLLDRARRLADLSFIDILRDLAPEGLNQVKIVAGTRED